MKRPLRPEELRLWSAVAATVHPLPGKPASRAPLAAAETPSTKAPKVVIPDAQARFTITPFVVGQHAAPARRPVSATPGPQDIEPRRKHRIARERDPIGGRIDLHGMGQDQARAALTGFLRRAYDDGQRAVLVITGKGVSGDGILRRRTPEWLAEAGLSDIVAGISEAHRRHGGEGALYVALKRKPRV